MAEDRRTATAVVAGLAGTVKVVSAYRRIEPYMGFHIALARAGYDWLEALRMLQVSAAERAGMRTHAITCDRLPVPHYRYATHEDELMLWVLEVQAAYLESADFDADTVYLSPDMLVCDRLDLFGDFDIALCGRKPKFGETGGLTLLNGCQFWALAAKPKLGPLFREALALARTLSKKQRRWGGDTIPLIELLGPIDAGLHDRNGIRLRVFQSNTVLRSLSRRVVRSLEGNERIKNPPPVVDFKGWRKEYHKRFYQRVFDAVC